MIQVAPYDPSSPSLRYGWSRQTWAWGINCGQTGYTNFELDMSLLIPNVTLFFECLMKVSQKLHLKNMVLEKSCTPLLPAWPTVAY